MITSIQNNQVKNWAKLHRRKYRRETGTFLIEGFHLVEEVFKSDWKVLQVIIEEGNDLPDYIDPSLVVTVSSKVFTYLSKTETPQGIMAVVERKLFEKAVGEKILLIDRIQDPGNLGTIIRTAVAAGFDRIVLGGGTVDCFNDKVLRATQGAIFHIPITEGELTEVIAQLKRENYTIVASALEDSIFFDEVNELSNFALILGNEGSGISKDILALADLRVKIPLYGKVESLNVSVAAGILMYTLK